MAKLYTPQAIANEFIVIAGKNKLTPMKVQKLVYFAHGWHLAALNKPLIDETIEAWQFGPVISSLYHDLKYNGSGGINSLIDSGFGVNGRIDSDDANTLSLLKNIWNVYGKYTGGQLSIMTHNKGTPWQNTYRKDLPRGTDIPNDKIKAYFDKLNHKT